MTTTRRKSRRRLHAHIFGGVIATVAIFLLLVLSWIFFQKYTQPASLASLLPADETLLYLDIKTDATRADARQLAQLFDGTDATALFDIDALGFADTTDFLALLGRRTGVAYLGDTFDAQHFVFVADLLDRAAMRAYLNTQTLAGEELHESLYLGYPVLSWPRSRTFAASFIGDDLILAADEALLRDVLETAAGVNDSLASTTSYAAVQARANPRGLGFGYLSKDLTDQLVLRQLGGLDYAVAAPLLDTCVGAGVELIPEHDGLRVRVSFVLNDEIARTGVFQKDTADATTLTDLLGEEVARFAIGQDIAGNMQQLIARLKTVRAHEALLTEGYIDNELERLLGIKFATVSPLLAGESLLGQTRTGGWFAAFAGAGMPEAFATLRDVAWGGNGMLLVGQERWRLPDDTTGTRHIADALREAHFDYNDVEITHVQPRGSAQDLYSVALPELVIIASEREQIEAMLTRAVVGEVGAFTQLVDASGLDTSALFFRHINSQIPQLQPFRYLFTHLSADAAVAELNFFFGI